MVNSSISCTYQRVFVPIMSIIRSYNSISNNHWLNISSTRNQIVTTLQRMRATLHFPTITGFSRRRDQHGYFTVPITRKRAFLQRLFWISRHVKRRFDFRTCFEYGGIARHCQCCQRHGATCRIPAQLVTLAKLPSMAIAITFQPHLNK